MTPPQHTKALILLMPCKSQQAPTSWTNLNIRISLLSQCHKRHLLAADHLRSLCRLPHVTVFWDLALHPVHIITTEDSLLPEVFMNDLSQTSLSKKINNFNLNASWRLISTGFFFHWVLKKKTKDVLISEIKEVYSKNECPHMQHAEKNTFGEETASYHIFLVTQTRKPWSVACGKFHIYLQVKLLDFQLKNRGKPNTTTKPPHQPTTCVLYTELPTVMTEEGHGIYRILSCSGSFGTTVLGTRFSASLFLISQMQDPLYEHNWLYKIHVHFLVWCFTMDPALPHHCSEQHSLSSEGGWQIANWGVAKSNETEGTKECHGFYRIIPNIAGNSVTLHLYNMKYYFITSTIIFINNSQVDLVI